MFDRERNTSCFLHSQRYEHILHDKDFSLYEPCPCATIIGHKVGLINKNYEMRY